MNKSQRKCEKSLNGENEWSTNIYSSPYLSEGDYIVHYQAQDLTDTRTFA